MTKICGRTACRSQHMTLYQCLCSILGSRTIFDLTTKTTCRNTAWNTSEVPIIRLATQTVPTEFRSQKNMSLVRLTTRYNNTVIHNICCRISITDQTNHLVLRACWQQCISESEDDNAQPKSSRKIKIRWRNISSFGASVVDCGNRAQSATWQQKKCRHTSPTYHNWYIHHPSSTYKIWNIRSIGEQNVTSDTAHPQHGNHPPCLYPKNTKKYSWHNDNADDCDQFPLSIQKALGHNTTPQPPHCENRSSNVNIVNIPTHTAKVQPQDNKSPLTLEIASTNGATHTTFR